jgi:phage baseplate assembly protein W
MALDSSFLGTGWAFPPTFEPARGRAAMVSREVDVHQSLVILMSTAPGERVMQPGYGCALRRMVFQHIDQGAIAEIRDAIEQAVLFHEVRVTLEAVNFDTSELGQGILRIDLAYTVRTTNTRHNIVFPFYYLQGTALSEGDRR